MLSKYLIIQRLEPPANVKQVLVTKDFLTWTFEHRRIEFGADDEDLFPFVVDSEFSKAFPRQGAETQIISGTNGLLFRETYVVSSGITIGILLPESHVPLSLKFHAKTHLPSELQGLRSVSGEPPGSFEIYYNRRAKYAAVVLQIFKPVHFGLDLATAQVDEGDFPYHRQHLNLTNPIQLSLSIEGGLPKIARQDLQDFEYCFSTETDLSQIADKLNELIDLLKHQPGERDQIEEKSSFIKRALVSVDSAASIVQLADSYATGNVVHKLITGLLSFLAL